jgi:hypothetical protein
MENILECYLARGPNRERRSARMWLGTSGSPTTVCRILWIPEWMLANGLEKRWPSAWHLSVTTVTLSPTTSCDVYLPYCEYNRANPLRKKVKTIVNRRCAHTASPSQATGAKPRNCCCILPNASILRVGHRIGFEKQQRVLRSRYNNKGVLLTFCKP